MKQFFATLSKINASPLVTALKIILMVLALLLVRFHVTPGFIYNQF